MSASLRILLAAVALMPIQASAQEAPPSSPVPNPPAQSPTQLAVVNLERLFLRSKFGTWVREERNAARLALGRESRDYDDQFNREEAELAEIKASLAENEFNRLATDFNNRVDSQRQIQDRKVEMIELWVDQQREFFVEVVVELMPIVARQFGLKLVLDANAVAWHLDSIDLTPVLRATIDAALANGNAIENIRSAWEFAGIDEAFLE